MRIENLVVNCTARYPRTCRRTPFEVVVYELNYSSEDKELMDLLRTKYGAQYKMWHGQNVGRST